MRDDSDWPIACNEPAGTVPQDSFPRSVIFFALHLSYILYLPVDGLCAVPLQEGVAFAEMPAAEKAAVSRKRAGMRCF